MSQQRIPILMYHQIDRIPPKVDAEGVRAQFRSLIVSPASFSRQMWLLKILGYRGANMTEVMAYLRGEKSIESHGKIVGITFDDGYQNNLALAMPVLRKHGFSSTCYAVSSLAGQSNTWDAGNGVAMKPLMTVPQMREWIVGGQEIGSHTRHHVNLNRVDRVIAKEEITQSKIELEAMTCVACKHFCYPYGHYDFDHIMMARTAGYDSATTTEHGFADASHGAFELPRIGILKNTNLFQFWRCLHNRGIGSPQ
jgi:peptidoglycan/xylan/chitin deacetylase (PgdA/CDA1 family)